MPTLLFDHGPKAGTTGILGETLREYGHRMKVVRLGSDALPTDLDDVDAIVLSDGPQTLLSGAPAWAAAEMALVREAQSRQLPICGLGFGARLLVAALGGELSAEGDVGWRDLKLNFPGREDPLYKGIPWTLTQLIAQRESIVKLPEGATPYGATATPGAKPSTRSFSAGVFAFGFEHQWWLNAALASSLAATAGADGAAITAGWNEFGANSMRHGRRLAESIALYLMPVDRVNSGRVKDLHY
jgi:GMP synthase-like glutamine amidotransferase